MRRVIDIRKAEKIEAGEFVVTPQHGTGVLLAHAVTETEAIDDGRRVEITTDDGRKHVVSREDRVVVVF